MHRFIALTVAGVLAASTAAEAAPRRADSPEQPSDPNEKIVCKTFTRIGTLASRYRTCKTKAEWQRERDNLRQVNVSDSCSTRGQIGGSVSPIPGNGNTFDC
ncbi:MAG TPA: hypothetical protein VFP12_14915 [Allosphingosinicella sp.]|nr:hypothetical protein [Allosphingosinicella sp.]